MTSSYWDIPQLKKGISHHTGKYLSENAIEMNH